MDSIINWNWNTIILVIFAILSCIFISPEEGEINPANIFANVDLPQPDSPTIPSDSFAFKLILILFTALKFIDCLLNKPLFFE